MRSRVRRTKSRLSIWRGRMLRRCSRTGSGNRQRTRSLWERSRRRATSWSRRKRRTAMINERRTKRLFSTILRGRTTWWRHSRRSMRSKRRSIIYSRRTRRRTSRRSPSSLSSSGSRWPTRGKPTRRRRWRTSRTLS